MKLRFEPDLDFQLRAVEAVCGLFRGQEACRTEFTVLRHPGDGQARMSFAQADLGVGNRLSLSDDAIAENLKAIQRRNGLPPSPSLDSGDFTVEMETGTGKTYVYLRTVFELNKRYDFTKFVIVVPSLAIKEGVYKSLQMTEDHFRTLYSGTPCEYFLYDSKKLGQVRNFAASPHVQIMVATVGAINKQSVNNPYKDSEKTGGEQPIDLIRATRPIVIVDEPQSVDGGLRGRGKEALGRMNPLCTLRYSATHADRHHMVYRLDAVDAYERKLVKQIEVAAATVEDAHNQPYVRLLSTRSRRGTISARVELDVEQAGKVRRGEVTVLDGDDLEKITGRGVYSDCIYRVVTSSGRLSDFRQNPQRFIENATQAINRCKQRAIVDGIRYQRLGAESYYAQELFEQAELTGYLKNMLAVKKAVHDHVLYESNTEAEFADQLEKNVAVKVYAKLPSWFRVPTPLGSYNPDWAVLVDSDDGERLYLVVETKGTTQTDELRPAEQDKIKCGKAHSRR